MTDLAKVEEIARLILSVSAVSYDEATNERRAMARAAAEKVLAALPPSPAVVTNEAPFDVFGQEDIDAAMENERTAQQFRDDLVASPSPPALDGAGREGWQPIETAPKDGTTILAWGPYNLEPCTVRWGPQRVGKEGWDSTWDGSRVIASETDFGTEYAEPDPLSHWMPLPAPPKETP